MNSISVCRGTAGPLETAPASRLGRIRLGDMIFRAIEWVLDHQDSAAERRHLLSLDERLLRDIGLSRAEAEAIARRDCR